MAVKQWKPSFAEKVCVSLNVSVTSNTVSANFRLLCCFFSFINFIGLPKGKVQTGLGVP